MDDAALIAAGNAGPLPDRLFFGSSYNCLIAIMLQAPDMRPLVADERYLGPYILPPFQRPSVWTIEQKVRLIESLYLGLPVGSLVWNQAPFDGPPDRWLLDGQQRLTAIFEYVAGEFEVYGMRFPDMLADKAKFLRLSLPMIETNITDPALCREVYNRLVYGGTVHAN